jgi:NADPH:quinone reductase-like Zn-dependent oxidoreductase
MVEIRVALTDATEAQGCCGVSRRSFDHSSVSFDGRCNEVRVRSEWESRSVVRVIRGRQGHTRGRRTFPLDEIPKAIRYLGEGSARGKVVITM